MRLLYAFLALIILSSTYAAGPGDLNDDNQVDLQDLLSVLQHVGRNKPYLASADLNSDGRVNVFDLVQVSRNWGRAYSQGPLRSNGQPNGQLAAGTTNTTLSLATNNTATCRYSTISGTAYNSMNPFQTTGGTTHSTTLSGLQDGQSYTYHVRCQDAANNTNNADYTLTFSVELPSAVTPFFEDNFDNGQKNSANGFTWAPTGAPPSTNIALSGTHSLRFGFGPVEPNGNSHWWTEQRFTLGRNLSEIWIEYWMYYPSNYVHGSNGGSDNNKFIRLWGDDYGYMNKVGASTWPIAGQVSELVFDYTRDSWNCCIGPGNSPAAVWMNSSTVGRWSRVRVHFKHVSAPGANDAEMQVWRDNELVLDFMNADQKYTAQPYWNTGYLLGYDNSGFAEETLIYIDDVKFYDQDPGWNGAPADTLQPTASITAPTADQQFAAGTTNTVLSVTTNEAATCRWSATDQTYASMMNTFATTGSTTHSTTLSGLSDGQSYTRYVRCQDTAGNAMTASQSRTFSVGAAVSSALFEDDFSSYVVGVRATGSGANGFIWGEGMPVHVAPDGSQALRFRYGPDPAYDDSTAEQWFNHPAVKEFWMEYYLWIPLNYYHRSQAGDSENNKFSTHQGPAGYSEPPFVMFQTWPRYRFGGADDGSSVINIGVEGGPDIGVQYPEPGWGATEDFLILGRDQFGAWYRIRKHIRIADVGASNGHIQLWKNNELLSELQNDDTYAATEANNFLNAGYLLGWSNSGFTEQTDFFIDNFKFYISDPGWTFGTLDSTPPTVSITAPMANQQLPANTTSTALTVTTNESATCRWSTTDQAYGSMPNTFTITGGTSHSTTLSGFQNGQSYTRYVRCQDAAGNAMTSSQSRSFSVAQQTGSVQPFFEDNFDTGQKSNANGFTWNGGPPVTANISNSGGYSLRFHYGPFEPNGDTHWWSEQRFSLGRTVTELWVEYYLYFPNGTEGLGSARYFHSGEFPSNNKFFRLWGPTHSDYSIAENKIGASLFNNRQNPATRTDPPDGTSRLVFESSAEGDGSNIGPEGSEYMLVPLDGSNHGRWLQIRQHYRIISGQNAGDALQELWVDGEKVLVQVSNTEYDEVHNAWDVGYIFGYDNAAFAETTFIYLDDIKFYNQNPGWS